MTTQNKKDSVQANDAVAKKPRKPRKLSTKNVDTTVPEVDATEVNFIGVKHHDLKEFVNSLVSVTDKEFVKVSCHSKPDMVDVGYSIITTNVFNKVKDALVKNHNVYYRDVGCPIGDAVDCGIVYISTDKGTHLCFILSSIFDRLLIDIEIVATVNTIVVAINYPLGNIKEKMVNAFLEQVKNMEPKQETDATNGAEVMVVEPAKQFHDESQFVLRAIDKGITENPGLEVVYMQIQGDTPNLQYSVMFTNRFDTLVNVLKHGEKTSCTERHFNSPVACAVGGVSGYDDSGKYKEYYFFVVDLGNKFSPEIFEDSAFLKHTFTHVKWAFESVERYRARRVYEVQDKGDTTMQENQVSQTEIVDAIRGVIGYDQEDAPLLKNSLCINSDDELAIDGYNILFTNDIRIIANIISKSNSMYILPIVKCRMKAAITGIYVGGKFIGLYIVEVIDDSGHVHESDFATFIHNTLWNGDDVHKPSMTVVKHALDNMLSEMAKSEDAVPVTGDNTASDSPKETQDLAKQIEMVDAVMGALGQIESTVPLFEVNLCINRNLDLAEKGYNVLFTNDFKAVINALDNLKEAGQLHVNHVDFPVAVAGVYVDCQLIQFYVVEELDDIAGVPDNDLIAFIIETMGMSSEAHKKIMEALTQKLGQKFVRRTVQEIDVLEANENAEREKVSASTERVPSGLGREPLVVKPVANSKQFPPFQPSRKSIIEGYREDKLKALIGAAPLYRVDEFGASNGAEFDDRRYNRHTFPNEVSERFSDVRIYNHTPRYHFGEAIVLAIVRDFMMKHNMPSIPTRDSLDNSDDQFTRELCRLENGSVVWNRAAMLTLPSCRQNKKEGKGINHYMLSVRDDERREFVICIYADYTNRKRPGFVVNYFEILEGDATPYVGNVARHLEHVLCQ